MLTFLRKIRKSLIGSGYTRKYLLYAIGEIALVVIGIMIALEVNNVNENKKTRTFEKKMLNEIRDQLIEDTIYLNLLMDRCTKVDTSVSRILEFYEEESNDTAYFEHLAHNLHWWFLFDYNDGAYDALKASGIEKISNDSHRTALIRLYDFSLPRTKAMLGEYRSSELRVLKEKLEGDIFNLKIAVDDDGTKKLRDGKYKLAKLNDPLFLQYLKMQQDMAGNGLFRIPTAIERVEVVLGMLDKELE